MEKDSRAYDTGRCHSHLPGGPPKVPAWGWRPESPPRLRTDTSCCVMSLESPSSLNTGVTEVTPRLRAQLVLTTVELHTCPHLHWKRGELQLIPGGLGSPSPRGVGVSQGATSGLGPGHPPVRPGPPLGLCK